MLFVIIIFVVLQARKNLQNRKVPIPRPQRPLTAMAASTLWTPRPRRASAATAPKCRGRTTRSSLRSSNSKKKSSSKASTCTINDFLHLRPSLFLLLPHDATVCSVCGFPKQVQQETKEGDPVSSGARHARYHARGSRPVFAPGGTARLGNKPDPVLVLFSFYPGTGDGIVRVEEVCFSSKQGCFHLAKSLYRLDVAR